LALANPWTLASRRYRTSYFSLVAYRALMPNLNVAVLGAPEYAKSLGKKSTTSDITFYDLKQGEVTVSIVEPSKYPEKLASLFFAASLADVAVLVIDQISPVFGETLVMLDCLGVKKGYIVLRNFIVPEQLAPLIKSTILEGYSMVDDDPVSLRERLLADAMKLAKPGDDGQGSVAVDHFFDVKGVGTVVLGCVSEGAIKKHDSVKVLPLGKDAEIRSIQKHDDDFDSAQKGDRVGLALKGVTIEDLDRGTVLSNNEKLVTRNELTCKASVVKYWQSPLKEGMVLHVGHWMQFEPARIESVSHGADKLRPEIKLSFQKNLVYAPGARGVLTYLEGGKLRVVGTIELG
jgi:selenocysteine-specific translation elongation factor